MAYKQKIKISIQNITDRKVGEKLFLTGSFNNWALPGLCIGNVPKKEDILVAYIDNDATDFECKVMRGSWETLVCDERGAHLFPYCTDSVGGDLHINIEGWRDEFPTSTAGDNVYVLDETFFFEKMNAQRKIWIYLPEDYHESNKEYPVLYMHDGQHLFDEALSNGRQGPMEWMVDKHIDRAKNKAIVVAIGHGENANDRLNDYLIAPTQLGKNPKGKAYIQDIVLRLKPFIDSHFRTLTAKETTSICGSSLGGIISLYAALWYPETFGSAGIFSPSLWLAKDHLEKVVQSLDTNRLNEIKKNNYYFYAGSKERRNNLSGDPIEMDKDVDAFATLLRKTTGANIDISLNPIGKHGAMYWQQEFPTFYDWWQNKLGMIA